MCAAAGVVRLAAFADHVVALVNGGADDESNLQPLCEAHHDAKTSVDLDRRPPRPAIGIDGWPKPR